MHSSSGNGFCIFHIKEGIFVEKKRNICKEKSSNETSIITENEMNTFHIKKPLNVSSKKLAKNGRQHKLLWKHKFEAQTAEKHFVNG